jgi:hypothetical protein
MHPSTTSFLYTLMSLYLAHSDICHIELAILHTLVLIHVPSFVHSGRLPKAITMTQDSAPLKKVSQIVNLLLSEAQGTVAPSAPFAPCRTMSHHLAVYRTVSHRLAPFRIISHQLSLLHILATSAAGADGARRRRQRKTAQDGARRYKTAQTAQGGADSAPTNQPRLPSAVNVFVWKSCELVYIDLPTETPVAAAAIMSKLICYCSMPTVACISVSRTLPFYSPHCLGPLAGVIFVGFEIEHLH